MTAPTAPAPTSPASAPAQASRPLWVRILIPAVIVAVVLAAGGIWWWRAHRHGVNFSALFTTSAGIYPGSDVRMLGVPVGSVDSVTPQGPYVKVSMHLDPGVDATADTKAAVVSPNLVSDKYVQLTGVYPGTGPKLRNGTVIQPSDTATPVTLDTLYQNLIQLTGALGPNGANKNGALSTLLRTGAANLGNGNGKLFNDTVGQLSQATTTLANSKDDIFGTITNLKTFTTTLAKHNSGLVTLNNGLASVSQTFADDRQSFSDAVHQLGTALNLVQTFVKNNRNQITANVKQLSSIAGTLSQEQASVNKALKAAPLLVQNLVNAYDPSRKVLRGRVDLNELSIWLNQVHASSVSAAALTGTGASAGASTDGPPTLLPTTGGTR